MALTFPAPLPEVCRFRSFGLDLRRQDFLAPEQSGRVGAVSGGWPLWTLEAQPNPKTEAQSDTWVAYVRALRGPQRLMLAADLTRPYPGAYPKGFAGMTRAGGGSFAAGTATSWSVNAARDVLTLNGLPAGFTLKAEDLIGFVWATGGQQRRVLVGCAEPATASGAGVAVVTVEPAVHTVVPGGAVAHLAKPTCLMRLTQDTVIGPREGSRIRRVTLSAIQVILP